MADVIIESNLPEVATHIEAMAAAVPLEAEIALGRVALSIKETYIQFLRAVTPRATGALADSSEGDVAVDGQTATITVQQTKTVPWRKHGGDYPLAQLLIHGHGAYPIDALGEAAGGKQALFWEGAAHPVRHVNMPAKAGIDYPLSAMENAQPDIDAELVAAGTALALAVVRTA